MLYRLSGLLLLAVVASTAPASTRDPVAVAPADSSQQRSQFLLAERALKQRDSGRYQQLARTLRDYPLYPYLLYQRLRRDLKQADHERVAAFLHDYADVPLSRLLRRQWLDQLAKQRRWQDYLDFYRPGLGTRRQCLQLQALLHTGQSELALGQVEPLWLSGRSQPKACDPVFDAWRKAGGLSTSLVWRRAALAINAGQLRLARYLQRFLPAEERAWLKRWIDYYRKPEQLARGLPQEEHPYRSAMLITAVTRLAHRDVERAIAEWDRLLHRYNFTPTEKLRVERRLAGALFRDDAPHALAWLRRLDACDRDPVLAQYRLRAALLHGEWKLILGWLDELPQEMQQEARWRYWRARALINTGHSEQARPIFQQLAGQRSYYGFMAADQINSPYALNHQPLVVDPSELQAIADLPGARRAHELLQLGRTRDARREWYYLTRQLEKPQLPAAAALARSWGWHDRAILTIARSAERDDLDLRFPLLHDKLIEQAAAEQSLDPAWVYAMIRRESAFQPDARSPVGALGLMQLMPGTARSVARKELKTRAPKRAELFQPKRNIRYGTTYLRRVASEFANNKVLASAAYNAGPHRVRRWLPQETLDADVWVELIPFRETREYVKRVLAYSVIYRDKLGGKPLRLSQQMPDVLPHKTMVAAGNEASPSAL